MSPAQDLLSSLVVNKKISFDSAEEVRVEALNSGDSEESILKRKRMVTDEDIARARAESLGIPFISLTGRPISPDIVSLIPEPVARRYTLVPFELDRKNNTVSVAMLDPLDFQVLEFLEKNLVILSSHLWLFKMIS